MDASWENRGPDNCMACGVAAFTSELDDCGLCAACQPEAVPELERCLADEAIEAVETLTQAAVLADAEYERCNNDCSNAYEPREAF